MDGLDTPDLQALGGEHKRMARATGRAEHALAWSAKLLQTEVAAGDPLVAEVGVNNPSAKFTYRFSPPARGFLVANLQVWYKPAADKKYRMVDQGSRVGHGIATGVPVEVKPGESRKWASVANNAPYHCEDYKVGRLTAGAFQWRGASAMTEPGSYDVALRYINLEPGTTWESPLWGARKQKQVRNGDQSAHDAVPVRVFGPFRVTVVGRPGGMPAGFAPLLQKWAEPMPTAYDVALSGDAPVTLTDKQTDALGAAASSVRVCQASQRWAKAARGPGDGFDKYEDALEAEMFRLPVGDPHRAALNFLRVAAWMERGDLPRGVAEAMTSGDADCQLLRRW